MQKEVGSLIVGVLALQGGVNEHVHHIESIGCKIPPNGPINAVLIA